MPGNRIQTGDIVEAGLGDQRVRVIGPIEVLGERPVGARAIDSLVFSYYASGRVTSPGDIVFCTSPRPTAIVDTEGDAVVEYPARVLRIDSGDPDGLLSETVRADINALPATNTDWRTWLLRRISHDQRDVLGLALEAIRDRQSQTRAHLAQLEELATLLIDASADSSVTLTRTLNISTPPEGTN